MIRAVTSTPPNRPPGRPPTGRTSDSERSARSKQALVDAGGRRLTVNLSPEAAHCVEAIKAACGLATDCEAIERALLRSV